MKKIPFKILKTFFSKKTSLLLCISIVLAFVVMASGYSILKTRFDVTGNSSIHSKETNPDDLSKICNSKLEFNKTGEWGNTFVYEITIYNHSSQAYKQWKLKIYDTGYITFPTWFEGKRIEDGWELISNTWNSIIEPGSKLTVSLTFDVIENFQDTMTIQEYAKYFVEHFIVVSGCGGIPQEQESKVITNGNASLTLGQFEEEVKTYTLQRNENYICGNPNEKQYILTIRNESNQDYIGIRSNIYFGSENTLVSIEPKEIIYQYDTNVTFETPSWLQIAPNETVNIYINIIVEEDTFLPDMVVAALIKQN